MYIYSCLVLPVFNHIDCHHFWLWTCVVNLKRITVSVTSEADDDVAGGCSSGWATERVATWQSFGLRPRDMSVSQLWAAPAAPCQGVLVWCSEFWWKKSVEGGVKESESDDFLCFRQFWSMENYYSSCCGHVHGHKSLLKMSATRYLGVGVFLSLGHLICYSCGHPDIIYHLLEHIMIDGISILIDPL